MGRSDHGTRGSAVFGGVGLVCRTILIAGLISAAGCNQPLAPEPPSAAKFYCPDLDGDGYSTNPDCSFPDCNETRHFAHPDSGYCLEQEALVCDPPDQVLAADFALFRRDSLLHVLHIRGPLWQTRPDTDGKTFGHLATRDGQTWTDLGQPFGVDTLSTWDDAHVWAPSVVFNPADALWYLFYTGVTRRDPDYHHEERLGMARSRDLVAWERVEAGSCEGIYGPGCLWTPPAWSAWQEDCYWCRQCRDPDVVRDPLTGVWYMVYTTARAPFDWTQVVGLARSTNLTDWTDLGPIGVTAGGTAESPQLLPVEDRWVLFWTADPDRGVKYATTSDPESGAWSSPDWVPESRQRFQVASQAVAHGDAWLWAWVDALERDIHLRSLAFTATGQPQQGALAALTCRWLDPSRVHPGAVELDNGIDDDCNGLVDEGEGPCSDLDGDGYGSPASPYCQRLGEDCDDDDPLVSPGAREICGNGIDDNCSGVADAPHECNLRIRYVRTRY